MVVYLVKIHVKTGSETPFIEATHLNREDTRKEEGNVQFDLSQEVENRDVFILYEVYESEDAVTAHKKTPHYLKWRETVAPMMKKPREGIKYSLLR